MKEIIVSNSKTAEARLYGAGAQIVREVVVPLTEKNCRIVIGNLPCGIDPQSILVTAGGAEISGVSFRTDHLTDAAATARTAELRKLLEKAQDGLLLTQSKIAVLEFEKEMLLLNCKIGSKDSPAPIADLKSGAEFLKKSFEENRSELLRLEKSAKQQQKEIAKLESELAESGAPSAAGTIAAELTAEKAGEIKLTVSYYLAGAFWKPFYEAYAAEDKQSVRLKLKAKARQNTGEDWTGVRLILSTADPKASAAQPELNPWYLRANRPVSARPAAYAVAAPAARLMSKVSAAREKNADGKYGEVMLQEYRDDGDVEYYDEEYAAQVDENRAGLEFSMNEAVDLPHGEERTVEVAAWELPAEFGHFAIPKADAGVFLLADIKDWEKLNLLKAPVSVYLGSAFVGKTAIDPYKNSGAFRLSLGRDKGVAAIRKKGRDFSGKKVFGDKTTTTASFHITVRNTKKKPVTLTLLDQLPVSTDKSIVVEPVDLAGAVLNKDKGELSWTIFLKPSEVAEKTIKYSVTYPTGTDMNLE